MLQALNERGDLIIPSTLTNREVARLREKLFFCPQCHEQVIIRAGPKVIPHFAHLPQSSCHLSHGGESNYHQRAKLQLFHWLQKQSFHNVYLEKYVPRIKQRPDILIETNNRLIAVEFQSATISPQEVYKRNVGYASENNFPLWIVGKNKFMNKCKRRLMFQIDTSIQSFIRRYRKTGSSQLLYYCPITQQFTILNDIYFYRANKALAIPTIYHMEDVHLRQLFPTSTLPKHRLYDHWYTEKKRFRLASYRVHGKELQFRKWLYKKRLHVEQLPSVIHLPIRSQYKMNVPLWHWQSKLVINLLHPLRIGAIVSTEICCRSIERYMDKQFIQQTYELIEQYFAHLVKAKLFVEKNSGQWQKTRNFRFHRYIEDSLRADRMLMNFLKQN